MLTDTKKTSKMLLEAASVVSPSVAFNKNVEMILSECASRIQSGLSDGGGEQDVDLWVSLIVRDNYSRLCVCVYLRLHVSNALFSHRRA